MRRSSLHLSGNECGRAGQDLVEFYEVRVCRVDGRYANGRPASGAFDVSFIAGSLRRVTAIVPAA